MTGQVVEAKESRAEGVYSGQAERYSTRIVVAVVLVVVE
jgi:hypothetical protein